MSFVTSSTSVARYSGQFWVQYKRICYDLVQFDPRVARASVFGAKPKTHDTRVKVQVFKTVSGVLHGCPDVQPPTRYYWQLCPILF